ncbi:MAG: tyrosine-type recombinase/integrase [Terriglobia bacterium]
MLETLRQVPFFLNRHREAPLLKEREEFLRYLQEQGTSRAALLSLSSELLHIIRLLRLDKMRDVPLEEIRCAADRFVDEEQSNPRARSYRHTGTFFMYAAKKWLRFHGHLRVPTPPPVPFAEQLDQFARYMSEEQGLSPSSVNSHCSKTSMFLRWIGKRRRSLATVMIEDIDDFLASIGRNGWNRKSVSVAAQALRAFFRYAGIRGWCLAALAKGIQAPKIYRYEGLPEGPNWGEMRKLLRSVEGSNPAALRARAILMLFAFYGLRSGEVCRLLLSDFDWRGEVFAVNHSKRGGVQRYPLLRNVGSAILEYLRKGRPQCDCRHLFVTLNPPYRPVSSASLWTLISRRMNALGLQCRRKCPHALRHARATRLLQQGASFKEIADLLGHRSLESTGIYAKVDLGALRSVAALDLGGLL